ncbi:MAG: hypothetical protein PVF70_10365 [Anaerolineales bacterium]
MANRDARIQSDAIPAYGKTGERSSQSSKKPAHVQAGLQALGCWQTKRQATCAGLTAQHTAATWRGDPVLAG